MQIIKTNEHSKYECPLKYTPGTNYTNRCSGPGCMWWTYNVVANFDVVDDKTFGYCGK